MATNTTTPSVLTASAAAPHVSAFERSNFGLVAAGFSFALILKYSVILGTRKSLTGTDGLSAIVMFLWTIYVFIQAINIWSMRTTGAIENFYWAADASTIFYSVTLCAILHMSVLRVLALSGLKTWRKTAEIVGIGLVVLVFVVRGVRTVFIFIQSTANANAALAQNATNLQIATLLPSLGIRIIFDIFSMYKLWHHRAKYAEAAGQEAFKTIVLSLGVETLLSIIAIVVAFQEAQNYTGDKLAFMDWLLFSWCLASWIEQRPLYGQIFGSPLFSTKSGSHGTSQSGGSERQLGKFNSVQAYQGQVYGGQGNFIGSQNQVQSVFSHQNHQNNGAYQGGY
ncbi:hypothetical protein HDU76_008206 [Blyttiomyces sp. JEL0837]|nr:hypothetical protein HDU76_008206 [Blyttiomyces sp. JEL0837]